MGVIKNLLVERKIKPVLLGSTAITGAGKAIQPIKLNAGRIFTEYHVKVKGNAVMTYASGAPTWLATGILNQYARSMSLYADSKLVFQLSPQGAQDIDFLSKGSLQHSGSSGGASAVAATSRVTVDNRKIVVGTTGQITSVEELITLNRAHPFCSFQESLATCDDFRKADSMEFRFENKASNEFMTPGNTAPLVDSAYDMVIEVWGHELLDVPDAYKVQKFNLSYAEQTHLITAASTADTVNLKRVARLGNIYMRSFTGAAGLAPADNVVGKVRRMKNGTDDILADSSFTQLQDEMMENFQINDPYVSNDRYAVGMSVLNLVRDSLTQSEEGSVLVSKPNVRCKTHELELTSTADVTLTSNARVRIIEEILESPLQFGDN
ncbi:MAG: hypothetical protein PHN88_16210 [Ignavibacteria bacterium]|nr:hypothetical protein [Ignavibacteria bacterium]